MIEFKRVRESDLEIIMNWRSSRKISKYLITEVSKDMDQQKKWFDEKVRNKFPPEHWVIFLNKIPIGFISMENYIEKLNYKLYNNNNINKHLVEFYKWKNYEYYFNFNLKYEPNKI